MPDILVQFADAIKGCFTAFDRMISRGRIMLPCTDSGATSHAPNGARVLFKDWEDGRKRSAKKSRLIISSLIQRKEAMFPITAKQARIMSED